MRTITYTALAIRAATLAGRFPLFLGINNIDLGKSLVTVTHKQNKVNVKPCLQLPRKTNVCVRQTMHKNWLEAY